MRVLKIKSLVLCGLVMISTLMLSGCGEDKDQKQELDLVVEVKPVSTDSEINLPGESEVIDLGD